MAIDPICGMTVDERKAIRVQKDGLAYYFCSESCKKKFLAQQKTPEPKIAQSKNNIIYTCPMHPEIRQDHPGDCPKCGMHLEPLNATGEDSEEQKLIHFLLLKFWVGLVLTIPLVLLVFAEMIPAIDFSSFIPHQLNPFIQFVLATPVVLWAGGMFLLKDGNL